MPSKRPYPLWDEIKMHVFVWSADPEWKSLPPALKQAITAVMNEVKIGDQLKQMGAGEQTEEQSVQNEKRRFLAVFRQRYNEYCGFPYEQTVDPTVLFIVGELVSRFIQEGTNSVEYLQWFFEDFMKDEYNKKKFAPPTLNIAVSRFVVDKFMFLNKDSMKVRKQDVINAAVKNAVIKMATDYLEVIRDRDFGQKVLDYSRGDLSLKKFSAVFMESLHRRGDNTRLEELKRIIGAE